MGVRSQGEARAGALHDQALDDCQEAEGDFLLDEVDRMIHNVHTGKTKLTKYSSAAEYLRHLDKMLKDGSLED